MPDLKGTRKEHYNFSRPKFTKMALLSHVSKDGKPAVKHVSRACLACRARHLKCDGKEPICSRCVRANRVCQYVKSNRGGSRRRGVTLKNKQNEKSPGHRIINSHSMTKDRLKQRIREREEKEEVDPDTFVLPCVRNGRADMEKRPVCHHQCMTVENFNKLPPCLSGGQIPHENAKINGKTIDMFPTFNSSKAEESLNKIFDPAILAPSLDECYISPALTRDLNVESVINTYYKYFQHIHPFLPSRTDIITYLNAIPYNYDLLLAMKIIGDGQSSNVYSADVETVQFLISSIVNFVKQVGKDFISLQSLLLLAIAAHISSLHDLSMVLREALVSLALELRINLVDHNNIPLKFIDVNGYITDQQDDDAMQSSSRNGTNLMNTPSESGGKDDVLTELMQARRVANVPKRILLETVRKTLWEVYFFDTISGTASGHMMSLLSSRMLLVLFPEEVSPEGFDYKSRAEACKLVNDSIKLNVAVQANKEIRSHLTHMRAAIGNWEMKLENPDMYNCPYLVNTNGQVNEGVFEAIMLVCYAQIFTHRPFSYLWRPDISKHPKCTDEKGATDNCPALKKREVDSRKIIETRKTIDSASFVVKSLLDTNPARITSRTPFLACALAFCCLVHLSAYSWVDSSLKSLENVTMTSALKDSINKEELETYTEYIKLELGAIMQISRHWFLSQKLAQHIRDTVRRVSPTLFKTVCSGLPEKSRKKAIQAMRQRTLKKYEDARVPEKAADTSMNYNTQSDFNTQTVGHTNLATNTSENTLLNMLKQEGDSDNRNTDNQTAISGAIYNASKKSNQTPNVINSPTATDNKPQLQVDTKVSALNQQGSTPSNGFNDTDLNLMTDDNYLSLSPTSDTGCDWVDKHVFEFDAYNIANDDGLK